jgi:hypothetical protein
VVGREGIGNLLWECHPPQTVVEDRDARRRYGGALYPLRSAMTPICEARGTERILGWYEMRSIRPGLATDTFGNFVPEKPGESPVQTSRWFVREGRASREAVSGSFEASAGGLPVAISRSAAGVIVRTGRGELVLALPAGRVEVRGIRDARAESGVFDGRAWRASGPAPLTREGGATVVETERPTVIRLTFRPAV